jgi:hypothetical protein
MNEAAPLFPSAGVQATRSMPSALRKNAFYFRLIDAKKSGGASQVHKPGAPLIVQCTKKAQLLIPEAQTDQ